MRFTDDKSRVGMPVPMLRRLRFLFAGLMTLLSGCAGQRSSLAPAPALLPSPAMALPRTNPPAALSAATGSTALAPPAAARTWLELKQQAARRMLAASPLGSYAVPVVEPLLAIPVLEIELNANGSVRRIDVIRRPTQAGDTVQLAMDAVHRAAPFGDVSRLPKPWKFTEAFLFDDSRRFKPRSLDQ